MIDLIERIESLKNNPPGEKVDERIEEFEKVGGKGNNRWFSELCFCVLTANCSAKSAIQIQDELGSDGFIGLSLEELQEVLEENGYRFYRRRAEYIVENRKFSENVKDIVIGFSDLKEARKWLDREVMGIGYKEASHFLRNVGYKHLMIVDRHILRILNKEGIIEEIPNTLTKKKYIEIEKKVKELAEKVNLSLAEIDLYLWFMETGEILK